MVYIYTRQDTFVTQKTTHILKYLENNENLGSLHCTHIKNHMVRETLAPFTWHCGYFEKQIL